MRLWHLVKANEESELPKHRKGSVRERGGERAKAIPEIYLTRLLSMKVEVLVMLNVSERNVNYTVVKFHNSKKTSIFRQPATPISIDNLPLSQY